ncbi:hypothetical protein OP500_07415 [Kingella sp. SNUBH-2017]|mgnify:FL=1|jgi:putative lipoprotein|uniref:Lipoprotein n=1 Tax=Kingella pumchi TaxID=2779506 RepID=A0ABS9NS25_9NEIS|nr:MULTISPECIES: hypothetical protein [Kingella]MCG6505098.1 hypothetical protein [Kingella pumchi]MDD2183135.1 hypothetical protein [Kingella sp. SNUBH-2017]
MNAKLSALITAAALLLAACGTSFNPQARPQLDVGESRRFKIERLDGAGGTEQVSLLVVQGEAGGRTRWIQTDAFGAPLARLSATERGWRRDGFVPPNHAAQALFTEMFPMLKDYSSDERDININAGGVKWRVTPLPPENGDE